MRALRTALTSLHRIASSFILPSMARPNNPHAGQRPVIAVIGTTGVGKSQLAVTLAQALAKIPPRALGGSDAGNAAPKSGKEGRSSVVLSADSMQLYKGLDVITNKATVAEQGGIEHWGLDIVQMGQGGSWEMGRWCIEADKRIESTQPDDIPIICGGTHYFIQHFLFPPPELSFERKHEEVSTSSETFNPLDIRWKPPRPKPAVDSKRVTPELDALLNTFWTDSPEWPRKPPGLDEGTSTSTAGPSRPSRSRPTTVEETQLLSLYELLSAVDPNEAGRWHWRDGRKVRRGLERWWERGGGDVRSASGGDDAAAGGGRRARFRTLIFWVYEPLETLRPRLEKRVDKMVENGLLREIAEMRKVALQIYGTPKTIDHTEGIFQSIGYKEFADLDLSQADPTMDPLYAQALAQTKSRTYQYAKSQIKWIKKQLLPAVREARGLGGEVWVYVVRGGRDGEADAVRALEAFMDGKGDMPDWKQTGHSDAAHLLEEVYKETEDHKVPDTAARQVINARRVCDTCSTPGKPYSIMLAEWDDHLKSRTHKKAVSHREGGKEQKMAEQLAAREAKRAERDKARAEKAEAAAKLAAETS